MMGTDPAAAAWRKSSFSASGNCVEVATQDRSVLIRNSKDPDEGMLAVSFSAWRAFIQAIQLQLSEHRTWIPGQNRIQGRHCAAPR
jgi:Domain of unknown function (DUF397)